ncbi:MAG: 50S ribosomal protein L6 [Candidatus Omnitrophica bacterium]|nr:50S ribosomal protein L6 [Candidatus Omnitrophota bacterium]MCA9415190.1 50S ribosomal protein L6 [Candidatus Omnitrophota bacterium]
MSRIGKMPVAVPSGVDVKIGDGRIEVKGPKGTLSRPIPPNVEVKMENGEVTVTREDDHRRSRAMHGLARALINNMVMGVAQGFQKDLKVQGVGYRATLDGKKLKLELGYSHPILYDFPAGIEIKVEKDIISVQGPDKEQVGQTAAEIRAFRKPEPYKGKGVRYVNEYVRSKVGKKNA